jgi:RNA polymerase sigma factor (sigma-70 family)
MAEARAPELARLLDAADPAAREAAWDAFIALHSELILRTARSVARDHDSAMDAYAYVIEALRADGCRRLRAYTSQRHSTFNAWLTVVCRRLCLDHHRHRYGRPQSESDPEREAYRVRRRLVDLLAEDLEPDRIAEETESDPAQQLIARERTEAITAALARLAPGDRLLLVLRFERDLSASQIARIVDLPTPFHVYRRLRSLLEGLRTELGRTDITGPDS